MRRYVGCPDGVSEHSKFDTVVIGGGLAGLYTALNLDSRLSCAVLTKEAFDISNSWLAQGGIAAAIDKDDRPEFHLDDTLTAGAGLCDERAVRVLVDEGPAEIDNLRKMNVPFDLNPEGDLQITREGGHTRSRVVHACGDATGRETVKTLSSIIGTRSNITVMSGAFVIDVLTDGASVCGVLLFDGKYRVISARNVVICSGGSGQVYLHTTNPAVATGDGIACAMRAGAEIRDLEFIQFHPTALYSGQQEERSFLISEAVRGEGAVLRNRDGSRFMVDRHPLAELAPRDIVARGIFMEMNRTGAEYVSLDITEKDASFLSVRFPTIYGECMRRGIDISKDYIPVRPVQHYMMGGIRTDVYARTNIDGLYACGEVACTGVHGANRLASNSMLECLVFGRRAALHINESGLTTAGTPEIPGVTGLSAGNIDAVAIKRRIKLIMHENCGVIRRLADMKHGIRLISALRDELEQTELKVVAEIEAYNMATVAERILTDAFARKESVGAHYIED